MTPLHDAASYKNEVIALQFPTIDNVKATEHRAHFPFPIGATIQMAVVLGPFVAHKWTEQLQFYILLFGEKVIRHASSESFKRDFRGPLRIEELKENVDLLDYNFSFYRHNGSKR